MGSGCQGTSHMAMHGTDISIQKLVSKVDVYCWIFGLCIFKITWYACLYCVSSKNRKKNVGLYTEKLMNLDIFIMKSTTFCMVTGFFILTHIITSRHLFCIL